MSDFNMDIDAIWTILVLAGFGYLFFLSQIFIHACSHFALTGNRAIDTWVGSVLSVFNFHSFEGWRALHMLHHRYTNTFGKDPACPRPGETWGRYLFNALHRMAAFTQSPFYRLHTSRGARLKSLAQQRGSCRLFRWALVVQQSWEQYLGLFLLVAYVAVSTSLLGPSGALLPLTTWVLPWVVGQMLMADFNYRTHEDCPSREGQHPYRGEDTRSFRVGIWRLFNILTFGFYFHQEHHIDPNICLWFGAQPHLPHRSRRRAPLQTKSFSLERAPTMSEQPGHFTQRLTVSGDQIDFQGHLSNVEILKLFNDTALAHSESVGWDAAAYRAARGMFVVRRNEIDYRRMASVGEVLTIETWVVAMALTRAERRNRITRDSDSSVIAECVSYWIFVNLKTGRPERIPDSLRDAFSKPFDIDSGKRS